MLAAIGKMLAIVALAGVIAAGYVQARGLRWTPDPVELEKERKKQATLSANELRIAAIRAQRSITLDELRDHLVAESIIVDARDAAAFAQGHLKAAVVVHIFGEDATQAASLQKLNPELVAGRPIVFYCNGPTCELSDLAYIAFEDAYGPGALDMFIFVPGWDGITAAGLETTTAPETGLWPGQNDAEMQIPVEGEEP